MNNLRSKLSNLKNACHIFRHYLRWPYPMYKPSQFDSFNHEHTCLASKLTNIELSDICPLAKAGQPFEVARENTCEECKYFCRIHYEVDPEYGDTAVSPTNRPRRTVPRCTTNSYHSEPPQKNSAYKKEW